MKHGVTSIYRLIVVACIVANSIAISSALGEEAPPREELTRRKYPSIDFPELEQQVSQEADSKVFDWKPVLGSLGIVIGLFFAITLLWRKPNAKRTSELPVEVFEFVGSTSIPSGQQIHLVRFGKRLLLLSQANDQVRTLSEVSEPHEFNLVLEACGFETNQAPLAAALNDMLQRAG